MTKKDPETDEDIADARWRIVKKDFFMQNDAKVNCAAFHAPTNLLVVGFSNGLFGLYDLPEFNMIHLLRYVASSASPSPFTDPDLYLVSRRATLMS